MMHTVREYIKSIDRTLLWKLGTMLIVYVIVGLLIFVKFREYSQLNEQRKVNKDATTRALKNASDFSDISKQRLQAELLLREVSGMLASPAVVKTVMSDISELATACNVNILEVVPEEQTAVTDDLFLQYCDRSDFRLDVECGYHQLGKLVEKIENFKYLIRVVSLKIIPNPKSDKLHLARITIAVFSKKKDFLEGLPPAIS